MAPSAPRWSKPLPTKLAPWLPPSSEPPRDSDGERVDSGDNDIEEFSADEDGSDGGGKDDEGKKMAASDLADNECDTDRS